MRTLKCIGVIICLSFMSLNAQTTTFDHLNANPLSGKSITWKTSNYGAGFGHRIINSDPAGKTLLKFQSRHNTATWSDLMALTSDGKVGIGTSNPLGKFHVKGETYIEDGWLRIKGTKGIFFQDYVGGFHMTDATWIRTYGNKSFYHNTGIMRTDGTFQVGSGGDRFIVNTAGNVGIGTTTPAHKLHVTSGAQIRKTTIGVTLASTENGWLRDEWLTGAYGPAKWDQTTAKWIRPGGTHNDIGGIVYQDEGTYFLREKAGTKLEYTNSEFLDTAYMFSDILTGNVGIGNTSPQAKLHVSGNILSNKLSLNDPNKTSDWNTLWQSGFYESFNAINAPEANVWFWGLNMNHGSNNSDYKYNGQIAIRNSSTTPTMYFRSTNKEGLGTWAKLLCDTGNQTINGNLGIGTTNTKGYKLGVQGKIAAEEVKVAVYDNWSDFVFETNYKLPTLIEVEQHIKEKGHLKDIPSAKEVAENGIHLGEMDSKLLQKIEELTLYTIQQEKALNNKEFKIKSLEEKLNLQEKRLKKIEQFLSNQQPTTNN